MGLNLWLEIFINIFKPFLTIKFWLQQQNKILHIINWMNNNVDQIFKTIKTTFHFYIEIYNNKIKTLNVTSVTLQKFLTNAYLQ